MRHRKKNEKTFGKFIFHVADDGQVFVFVLVIFCRSIMCRWLILRAFLFCSLWTTTKSLAATCFLRAHCVTAQFKSLSSWFLVLTIMQLFPLKYLEFLLVSFVFSALSYIRLAPSWSEATNSNLYFSGGGGRGLAECYFSISFTTFGCVMKIFLQIKWQHDPNGSPVGD